MSANNNDFKVPEWYGELLDEVRCLIKKYKNVARSEGAEDHIIEAGFSAAFVHFAATNTPHGFEEATLKALKRSFGKSHSRQRGK
jgi:hypothetical protein